MKYLEAPWITTNGGVFISIDFHPAGRKVAIAGQDKSGFGLLTIWDIGFIHLSEKDLDKQSCYSANDFGLLTKIQGDKPFNCVRWDRAGDGCRFACSGDDPTIYIYKFLGSFTSHGSLSSSLAAPTNQIMERYKCTHRLNGHTMDVTHLEWSLNCRYLASCSMDKSIIIWNSKQLAEKIIVLTEKTDGHDQSIKGLSWDPYGRFLVSQDDFSLKIWKIDTWTCVQTIKEPFKDSVHSILYTRMDWTPDGGSILAPASMNCDGPTLQIISRKDWTFVRDFVGFRKATTCVVGLVQIHDVLNAITGLEFRKLYRAWQSGAETSSSFSLWIIPNFSRPIFVLENMFEHSILDLSWHELTVAAVSNDGAVKFLKFSQEEIGRMLTELEMGDLFKKNYGSKPVSNFEQNSEVNNVLNFDILSVNESKSADDILNTLFGQPPPPSNVGNLHKLFKTISRIPRPHGEKINCKPKEEEPAIPKDNPPQTQKPKIRSKKKKKKPNIANSFLKPDSSSITKRPNISELRQFRSRVQKRILISNIRLLSMGNQKSTVSIHVQNEYGSIAGKITSVIAFRSTDMKKIIIWRQYIPKIVSLIAANRNWTALTTLDGCLIILLTKTGRIISNLAMEEVTFSMCLQGNILRVETKAGPISFNLYRMDLMDAKSALINKAERATINEL